VEGRLGIEEVAEAIVDALETGSVAAK